MLSKFAKFLLFFSLSITLFARDLDDIKKDGVLIHLGIPYANFVTGFGDGLDVELIQGFASYLGVEYKFQKTDWNSAFGDLTGQNVKSKDDDIILLDKTQIKGDLIANGLTVLPWREKAVAFSMPTFPSSVWLIAKSNSSINPIIPSNSLKKDIEKVKSLLKDKNILTRPNTCLDASLYNISSYNANVLIHPESKSIIEMIPAIINTTDDLTLLDVPDALIALEKWQGEIKIIGPVSQNQDMAVGFRKDSPKLLKAFNDYMTKIKADGTYHKLVEKYYPAVFDYYEEFFKK